MSGLPPLPREISSDGREIWDWAAKLSEATHRAHKIRELRADIARKGCGGCKAWMTRQCPRERHDMKLGRSVGPSSSGLPCNRYDEKPSMAELREKWRVELAGLEQSS